MPSKSDRVVAARLGEDRVEQQTRKTIGKTTREDDRARVAPECSSASNTSAERPGRGHPCGRLHCALVAPGSARGRRPRAAGCVASRPSSTSPALLGPPGQPVERAPAGVRPRATRRRPAELDRGCTTEPLEVVRTRPSGTRKRITVFAAVPAPSSARSPCATSSPRRRIATRSARCCGLVHVVGGEEDRLARAALQPLDHVPGVAAGCGVEAGGGLVEEDQLGVADDPDRDVDAAAAGRPRACRSRVALVGQARPARSSRPPGAARG